MLKIYAILGAIAVAAFSAGLYFVTMTGSDDQFAACRGSAIAGGTAAIGGPFELINASGETVTDEDVITKPSILYFGFTFCPDVCPMDVDRNAWALEMLAEQGRDAQGVFISIDPERDTPEMVGEFASYFDYTIGLTGSPEQTAAASRAYRTYYQKQDSDDEFYLINHSTQSYLVLPEHGFVEFFKRSDTPEQMAERIGCFIDAA